MNTPIKKAARALLLDCLRHNAPMAALGIVSLILVNALEVCLPLILRYVVDLLEGPIRPRLLLLAALAYLLTGTLQSICRFGWRFFLSKTGVAAGQQLRERLVEKLLLLPVSFFHRHKTGELAALATNDIDAISNAFSIGIVIFFDALFFLVTTPVVMLWLAPEVAWLTFLPLLFIPLLVMLNEAAIRTRFKGVQASLAEVAAYAQESFTALRLVKAFGREHTVLSWCRGAGKNYLEHSVDLARREGIFQTAIDMAGTSAGIVLLFAGGPSVITGALGLGTFLALQRYVQQLIWPLQAIGFSVSIYQRALGSAERVRSLLSEEDERQQQAEATRPQIEGRLRIENLSFCYGDKPVLSNVSLRIEAGQWLGILGDVGSGKSTLLALLPRLYPPPPGTVWLDDADANLMALEWLRAHVAYAPQDAFLFDTSVSENLAIGVTDGAPDLNEQIEYAARQAQIHDEILGMDEGYARYVGERGGKVSGGQRQRLAVARALLKKSPFLVLDDPFAALDARTEQQALQNIRAQYDGTVVLATQRLSASRYCDYLAVLKDGRLLQYGRHEELLVDAGGWYAQFYRRQTLEEELSRYAEGI